jgi:hypothetical protein
LPPRSSWKDTWSGWCTSPTQWPRYFRASSLSCSVALDDDSTARSLSIAEMTQSVARGHGVSAKVNLSSERVRMALGIIEGVRNGQRLGALLS